MRFHGGVAFARVLGVDIVEGIAIDNVASELHVVILQPISHCTRLCTLLGLTANSPISASSIPSTSASSLARRPRPGSRFIKKRIRHDPQKE
jgi:hypothetical protein